MNFKLKSIRNIAVAMWMVDRKPFCQVESFSEDHLGVKKRFFGLAKIAYETMRQEVLNELSNSQPPGDRVGTNSTGSGGNSPSSGHIQQPFDTSRGMEFTEDPPTAEEIQSVKLLLSARGGSGPCRIKEEVSLRWDDSI